MGGGEKKKNGGAGGQRERVVCKPKTDVHQFKRGRREKGGHGKKKKRVAKKIID